MAFGDLNKAFAQSGAPTWNHEDGDQIVGEVVARREQANQKANGRLDPVLTLKVIDGHRSTEQDGMEIAPGESRTVYCSRAVLRSFVERENPQVGDFVALRQNGTYTSKSTGNQGVNYDTAIERQEKKGASPWDE